MKGKDTRKLRGALLSKGHTFTSIALELGCTPQHVRNVAAGLATSAPVTAAIAKKLRRRSAA